MKKVAKRYSQKPSVLRLFGDLQSLSLLLLYFPSFRYKTRRREEEEGMRKRRVSRREMPLLAFFHILNIDIHWNKMCCSKVWKWASCSSPRIHNIIHGCDFERRVIFE